ncbi:MAG: hypothetical protein Q7T20_11255 [Saprospiraceae bacterium]|nr:hypothetical protein [Saprospiraceae bacterium]
MKSYLGILLLLTACFVALPTSTVLACDNAVFIQGQVKAALSSADDHCVPTADDPCNDMHPGQDCPPDTDGCGHCHCPGCCTSGGMTYAGFFKSTFTELPAPDWSYDRRAANFCYGAPDTSAHLTALFQPPRV